MPAPKRIATTLAVAAALAGAAPAAAGAAAAPIVPTGTALPVCGPNGPLRGQPDPIGMAVPYRPYACLLRGGPMDGGPVEYPMQSAVAN
jgi:hypothetical protein